MSPEKVTIHTLLKNLRNYLETKVQLTKLTAIEKTSDLISHILAIVLIFSGSFLALALLSLGLASYLGDLMDNLYLGYFIVGGFYGIMLIVLMLTGKKWIREFIFNSVINKLLNEKRPS